MPEKFSIDDPTEEVVLLHKIEKARGQMANGNFMTEEELDKEIDSWNQSSYYFKP